MKRIFAIAALAILATAANAQNNNAAAPSTTNAVAPAAGTTVVAANGQSATVVADPEAAATAGKSWSVTFVNQTAATADQINYSNIHSKSLNTINYIGGGYKIDAKNRLGVRQYLTVDRDGPSGEYKSTMIDTALTYTRNMDGVLKSDPISAMLWYYIPNSDASRDARSNGQVRLDMELAYTLSPKWTVSYYFNPRQNLIPNGEIVAAEGKVSPVFSKTTLIHYASLYYNFNDTVTAYTYGGYKHRWKTSSMTLNEEALLTAVGTYFTLAGGKIQLNPEISVESAKVKDFQKIAAGQDIQEENISYALTSAFSF